MSVGHQGGECQTVACGVIGGVGEVVVGSEKPGDLPALGKATPEEDAVCAKSFSEPPTKIQGSGTAGLGCLRLGNFKSPPKQSGEPKP